MSAFSEPDADVVKAACKLHGLNPHNHVTMGDKLILKNHTGLSVSLISRALTNIRKGHK